MDENSHLLATEQEFACPCGCGATAKGIFRPTGWIQIMVYGGGNEYSQVLDGATFATPACVKRFFCAWEPERA